MDQQYKPQDIEANAQRHWVESGIFKAREDTAKPKYYCLSMLPYPSGKLQIMCATAFPDLPDSVRRNRAFLVHLMTTEGFVNYPREWWHFSYGDQYWAYNLGKSEAIYGSVESG